MTASVRRAACLGAALLAATAAPALGQTATAYRARVERLAEAYRRAVEAADSADRALRSAEALDTIAAGTLVALTHADRRSAVRAGTARAWGEINATLGADSGLLDGAVFYVPSRSGRRAGPHMTGRETIVVRVQGSRPIHVQRRLTASVGEWLSRGTDTAFAAWLGGALPVTTAVDWNAAWIDLTTGASYLAGDCGRGDPAACRAAFALTPSDDPVLDWYDDEGRRALVRGLPGLVRRDPDASRVCLERAWDPVCVTLLRLLDPRGVPPPFGLERRADLVRHALASGGEGAYGRLLASLRSRQPRSVVQHITAASGVTADSLLGDWVATALASRPPQVTLELRGAIAGALWAVLFGAAALRNTRWR